MGRVIHDHTRPGDIVGTWDFEHPALEYYARRWIVGSRVELMLTPEGLVPSLYPLSCVVIPQKVRRPHAAHSRLLTLLQAAYPYDLVETEDLGRIFIFDVSQDLE
jgi:hypothetical protein